MSAGKSEPAFDRAGWDRALAEAEQNIARIFERERVRQEKVKRNAGAPPQERPLA